MKQLRHRIHLQPVKIRKNDVGKKLYAVFFVIFDVMLKSKKYLVVAILMALLISSCGLFGKKNKCHTCPAWSKNVEHLEESHREK